MDDTNIRRLGWAGHFIRMEDERIPKKVLNGKFRNTRPVGKPRTRREDNVQTDTSQILGIRHTRTEETSRRQRREEASSDGGQGPAGAVVP